jgi:hypothetical protein
MQRRGGAVKPFLIFSKLKPFVVVDRRSVFGDAQGQGLKAWAAVVLMLY